MAGQLRHRVAGQRGEIVVVAASVATSWLLFVVVPVVRGIPLEHQGGLSLDALLPGLAWTLAVGLAAWYLRRIPGRRSWPWLLGVTGVVLLTGSVALLPFEFAVGEAEDSTWTAFFPVASSGVGFLSVAVVAALARRRWVSGGRG